MALSEVQVRKAKPQQKKYTIRDSQGLFMEVQPTGTKTWVVRFMKRGQTIRKVLGRYPDISLKDARIARDKIRIQLHGNEYVGEGVTFSTLAEEWYQKKVLPVHTWNHARTIRSRLDRLVLPSIGNIGVQALTPPELLAILRQIEARGHLETAHRVLQILSQVFRYGIATGQTSRDIVADLRGALTPIRAKHHPTITDPEKIGGLMRAVSGFSGSGVVRCAMLFGIYTAVRPGELRKALWSEIDRDLWKIPAERMKMKRPHLVPLSPQAMAVLDELRPLSGHSSLLFPSLRNPKNPISDMTVNAALRRLGYAQEELTGHGFRSMFSTIANEHQWPSDVIERQLAHVEKNTVRAAYNHAELLDKRRELMNWWGEWLEEKTF